MATFGTIIIAVIGAGIAVAAAVCAYVVGIRPWHSRWGATDAEVQQSLPGDDLVPQPKIETTRAITIRGSATDVWPWLVQIGYKRAGWYSYDFMHRMLRCAGSVDDPRRSANRIIPELQNLQVGDSIHIAAQLGYRVTAIQPERVLVLHTAVDTGTGERLDLTKPMPETYLNASWVWFLDEVEETTTRLIVRFRQDYHPSLLNALMYRGFIESGGFLMERKTLLGIKQRAEAAAGRGRE